MKEYILGIDIGTSSLKVCAVDCRGNKLGKEKQVIPPLSRMPGGPSRTLMNGSGR